MNRFVCLFFGEINKYFLCILHMIFWNGPDLNDNYFTSEHSCVLFFPVLQSLNKYFLSIFEASNSVKWLEDGGPNSLSSFPHIYIYNMCVWHIFWNGPDLNDNFTSQNIDAGCFFPLLQWLMVCRDTKLWISVYNLHGFIYQSFYGVLCSNYSMRDQAFLPYIFRHHVAIACGRLTLSLGLWMSPPHHAHGLNKFCLILAGQCCYVTELSWWVHQPLSSFCICQLLALYFLKLNKNIWNMNTFCIVQEHCILR